MDEEIITFGGIEIEKEKFYRYKSPICLEDVNINKVKVSNKIYSSEINKNTLLVTSMIIIKLSHYM